MKNRLYWHLCLTLIAMVLFLPEAYSVNPTDDVSSIFFSITENGKVIDYLENYFVVNVYGTLQISNPHSVRVYSLLIPSDFDTLTFVDRSDSGYVTDAGNFLISELDPGEVIEIEYSILGISPTNPLANGSTVLHTLIDEDNIEFLSRLEEQLFKAPLENSSSQPDTRLISVHINNPTDFEYIIENFRVFKTTDLNPNNVLNTWIFPSDGNSDVIEPRSLYVEDFLDTDASEGEVYWMVTDISIRNTVILDFTDVVLQNVADEQGFFIEAPTTVERELEDLVDRAQIDLVGRKTVSKSVVNPGDIINVSIIVDNFASLSNTVSVFDEVPPGFTIVEAYGNGQIRGDEVFWASERVPGRNSRHLKYAIQFNDAEAVGLVYLDGARIETTNQTVYTPKVPLIRRYQPESVIYLQKRLTFHGADEVEVTLTLQNLGEAAVSNLLLKEFLDEENEFREITYLPREKGLWEITSLGAGESWSVSYVTDQHTQLNTLPEIYGVDRATITKSIMLVNTVEYRFFRKSVKPIEIFGIIAVVLIPLLYFLLHKYGLPSMPQGGGIKRVKTDGSGGELHIIKEKIDVNDKK